MRIFGQGMLLAGALSIVGCGSGDAATDSSTGGSGGTSGGSGESGAAGAGAADSAPKSGFIGVTSQATALATVFRNSVGADFYDGHGNSFAKGCTRDVVGACAVVLCDLTNGGDQAPPPGAIQSAGAITVAGTTPKFSLAYDAGTMKYGSVPAPPTDQLIFTGGDTIVFAAAGADVPAFSDTLVAPSPLAVTSPALPGGALSIDTGKDLVFAWTGSSVGKLSCNVFTTTSSAGAAVSSSFVSCQFDASALTGAIPTALLQKLHKTDATTTARFGTDLSTTKEVVAGDYMIHLAVGSATTQADGKTPYAPSDVTIF